MMKVNMPHVLCWVLATMTISSTVVFSYEQYEFDQHRETVDVDVTGKAILYPNTVNGTAIETHFVVFTDGEAFEIDADLYGSIEEGPCTFEVSGVRDSFFFGKRRIVKVVYCTRGILQ